MENKKELEKDAEIKKEIRRLIKLCKDIEENKRKVAEGLIEECAFMRVTLKELRQSIDENGVIDEMPQGEYSILRESPYVKTYHTMIQRYTTASDKLLSLIPKKETTENSNDGFDDFVDGREDL